MQMPDADPEIVAAKKLLASRGYAVIERRDIRLLRTSHAISMWRLRHAHDLERSRLYALEAAARQHGMEMLRAGCFEITESQGRLSTTTAPSEGDVLLETSVRILKRQPRDPWEV